MRLPLNAYVAIALAGALVLSPLLVLASPLIFLCIRRQHIERDKQRWRVLWPSMARTLQSMAPVVLRGESSVDQWVSVPRRIDDYLAQVRSARRWRTLLLLVVLEYAPLLRGYAPLSRLTLARRMRFADHHLAAPRGLMRVIGLTRQLVRIGHFGARITTLRVEPRSTPRRAYAMELSA